MSQPRSVARGDLVAGGLTVALGVAVLLTVRGYPELPGGGPGPALFPGIVAGLLILFGAVLAVRALLRRTPDEAAAPGPPRPTRRALLNAGAILLAVVAYVLLADILGFAITMVLLLAVLIRLLGARLLVAVGAAVATTVLVTLVFQVLLLVPLPRGPLGF